MLLIELEFYVHWLKDKFWWLFARWSCL